MRYRVKAALRAGRGWLADRRIGDTLATLVFVHIGKCGGQSLWSAIRQSDIVQDRFSSVERVHIRKPPVRRNARYLFVVRNPVDRAISAFNWRRKRLTTEVGQRRRFEGEREALAKYDTLSDLAEALYIADEVNPVAARDFNSIHHLKENIAFYLSDLLGNISADQVFAVLSTETLEADIQRQLGVSSVPRIHENGRRVPDAKKTLSSRARRNLKRFLAADYDCLRALLDLHGSCMEGRATLLA